MSSLPHYPTSASVTSPSPHPTAPPVIARSIPGELRQALRWVVWKYERRGHTWTKPPRNARTGGYAKVTNRATWSSFSDALTAYQRGGYDGIGFMLDGDGMSGIDLDHCRDPHTGAIAPWAQRIITEADSYTEVSPSGTGIRIFTRGKLPPGGHKAGGIELYDDARYLTVTGHHLEGSPITIHERTAVLAAIHTRVFSTSSERPSMPHTDQPATPPDDTLLNVARRSKDGTKFRTLFDHGDTSSYPSASEADLALCGFLAWLTGRDAEHMDALFRQSALFRPEKWDTNRRGQTYGQLTITKAIAGCRSVYQGTASRTAPSQDQNTEADSNPNAPTEPPSPEGKHGEGACACGCCDHGHPWTALAQMAAELEQERRLRHEAEDRLAFYDATLVNTELDPAERIITVQVAAPALQTRAQLDTAPEDTTPQLPTVNYGQMAAQLGIRREKVGETVRLLDETGIIERVPLAVTSPVRDRQTGALVERPHTEYALVAPPSSSYRTLATAVAVMTPDRTSDRKARDRARKQASVQRLAETAAVHLATEAATACADSTQPPPALLTRTSVIDLRAGRVLADAVARTPGAAEFPLPPLPPVFTKGMESPQTPSSQGWRVVELPGRVPEGTAAWALIRPWETCGEDEPVLSSEHPAYGN